MNNNSNTQYQNNKGSREYNKEAVYANSYNYYIDKNGLGKCFSNLGLDPEKINNYNINDVKQSYKKQAVTLHPDRHPNNPDKAAQFIVLSSSNEVVQYYYTLKTEQEEKFKENSGTLKDIPIAYLDKVLHLPMNKAITKDSLKKALDTTQATFLKEGLGTVDNVVHGITQIGEIRKLFDVYFTQNNVDNFVYDKNGVRDVAKQSETKVELKPQNRSLTTTENQFLQFIQFAAQASNVQSYTDIKLTAFGSTPNHTKHLNISGKTLKSDECLKIMKFITSTLGQTLNEDSYEHGPESKLLWNELAYINSQIQFEKEEYKDKAVSNLNFSPEFIDLFTKVMNKERVRQLKTSYDKVSAGKINNTLITPDDVNIALQKMDHDYYQDKHISLLKMERALQDARKQGNETKIHALSTIITYMKQNKVTELYYDHKQSYIQDLNDYQSVDVINQLQWALNELQFQYEDFITNDAIRNNVLLIQNRLYGDKARYDASIEAITERIASLTKAGAMLETYIGQNRSFVYDKNTLNKSAHQNATQPQPAAEQAARVGDRAKINTFNAFVLYGFKKMLEDQGFTVSVTDVNDFGDQGLIITATGQDIVTKLKKVKLHAVLKEYIKSDGSAVISLDNIHKKIEQTFSFDAEQYPKELIELRKNIAEKKDEMAKTSKSNTQANEGYTDSYEKPKYKSYNGGVKTESRANTPHTGTLSKLLDDILNLIDSFLSKKNSATEEIAAGRLKTFINKIRQLAGIGQSGDRQP